MTQKRIGILRGGVGRHYKASLIKGGDIISHILEKLSDKYKPIDILIDKDYIWHCGGIPINPGDLVQKIDVAWNTTHPSFANILESLSIPHIGTGSFLGTLLGNREMFKKHVRNIGIKMPRHIVLPVFQKDFDGPRERYSIKKAKEIFEKFGSPWIVKSFTPDSNMGIHLAQTFPELVQAIEDGVNHEESIVIEEFISGSPVTTHSVVDFRGEDVYVLPPENLSVEEKEKIISSTRNLHKHLNAKHYLKMDYVLHPKRGVFLSNIEFIPDLRPGSHLEKSCESIGTRMHDVVEHILERAL